MKRARSSPPVLRSRTRAPSSPTQQSPSRPTSTVHTPATPGTPGPVASEVRRLQRIAAYPPLSPGPSSALGTVPRCSTCHPSPPPPRRTLFGTPVSPPPRRRLGIRPLSPSPMTRSRSNSGSQRRQQHLNQQANQQQGQQDPPPQQQQEPPQGGPDLQEQLTQLTQAVATLVQGIQPPAVAPQPQQPPVAPAVTVPVGPPEDPNFDWQRLRQTPETNFPPATVGQIQLLAAALLAKLPLLTGRDHHEVAFLLSVTSDYPEADDAMRNLIYQRLNLLYIATHHGWGQAIRASSATTASIAVFPPGFTPEPERRPAYRRQPPPPDNPPQQAQQQRQQAPQQQQQQRRGRGRGNQAYRRRY